MGALLFPGQGSQVIGMGSEFYQSFKLVKDIFKEADETLKFSISRMIMEGPEKELQLTKNTQPAILTVSYSIFKVLKEEFNFDLNSIKFFAGHSLGEYSALVCSGSLNYRDALNLLHERGKAMQDAVPVGKGSMIAVLGIEIENLIELMNKEKEKKGVCEIANDNAKGQVIVSGDLNKINDLKTILKKEKIKFIPLKVSAPFHCALMQPATEIMREKINLTKFLTPSHDIVCNVTASPEKSSEMIKKLLIDQIVSTVKWRESLINMSNAGINNFIEIGPGKALVGMVKRTIDSANLFSINSIADIKKLINELKK